MKNERKEKKRKALCLIIGFVIALSALILPAAAAGEGEAITVDSGTAELLRGMISDAEWQLINDKSLHNATMDGVDLSDAVLIKYHRFVYWEHAGDTLDEVVETAEAELSESNVTRRYWVWDDGALSYLSIFRKDGATEIGFHRHENEIPEYVEDILRMTVDTEIDGVPCRVERIHCFDGTYVEREVVVFLETDRGNFVKVYDGYGYSYGGVPRGNATVMTEEEFGEYATGYARYLYAFRGCELANGPGPGFAEYVKNPDADRYSSTSGYVWIICSVAAVVAVAAVTVVIVARRGSSRKNRAE